MAKYNFTKAFVEEAPIPEGKDRVYYYDSAVRGLALKVTRSGVRTYVLYRWVSGKPERVTLGRHPDLSVEAARKKAEKGNAEFADGKNPAEDKRKVREESTLGELLKVYLDLHAKPYKKTWEEDQAMFDRHMSKWKNRKISDIKIGDVQRLHAAIGKGKSRKTGEEGRPYGANRCVALLSSMFTFARRHGFVGANPVQGVKRFREQSRARFLQPHELPAFFKAVAEEGDQTVRDYILLSLLTGARRGALLAMKWSELSLVEKVWTIPPEKSKNGREMTIPLVDAALKVLESRPRESEYVLPSATSKTGHLVEPKRAWKRILVRAKIENLRLHDMRRSLGSWEAALGTSLAIIGRSLGHLDSKSTLIYSRLSVDPVRKAMEGATTKMLEVGGMTELLEGGKVVDLKTGKEREQ